MIVLRNSTPVIVSTPRVDVGAPLLRLPTSASVRVSTASTPWPDEVTGWTSATIDSLDEAVLSPADEGGRDLFLDAADVVVGRSYLVVDTDATFVVSIEAKDAGRVYLAEPLRRPVSDAARLRGWTVAATLTTAQTADVGPAIAQFRCTLGDAAVSWTEAFRVARRLPVVPLTSSQLVQAYPEIKSLHSRQDSTLEQTIASAWEHVLLPRILRRDVYPEDIVNPDALRPLLAIACMLHVTRQARQLDVAVAAMWQSEFDRLLENTLARIDWHVEPQDTPTIPLVPSQEQRAQRFTRLVR